MNEKIDNPLIRKKVLFFFSVSLMCAQDTDLKIDNRADQRGRALLVWFTLLRRWWEGSHRRAGQWTEGWSTGSRSWRCWCFEPRVGRRAKGLCRRCTWQRSWFQWENFGGACQRAHRAMQSIESLAAKEARSKVSSFFRFLNERNKNELEIFIGWGKGLLLKMKKALVDFKWRSLLNYRVNWR